MPLISGNFVISGSAFPGGYGMQRSVALIGWCFGAFLGLPQRAGAQRVSVDSAARLVALADVAAGSLSSPAQVSATVSLFHAAAQAYHRLGDKTGEGNALTSIAEVFAGVAGRADSTQAYLDQALAVRRSAGDKLGIGITLGEVGAQILWAENRATRDSGIAYLARAVPIFRELRADTLAAQALLAMGRALGAIGVKPSSADSGLRYLRAADSLARASKVPYLVAEATELIGDAFLALRRPDSVVVYYSRALVFWRGEQSPDAAWLASAMLDKIGMAYVQLGLIDSAQAVFRRVIVANAEPTAGDQGKGIAETRRVWRIGALFGMAEISSTYGAVDSAMFYSRSLFQAASQPPADTINAIVALALLAQSARRAGQPDSAIRYGDEALRQAARASLSQRSDRIPEQEALEAIGLSFVALGRPDSALYYFRKQGLIGISRARSYISPALLTNVGAVYQLMGRADTAIRCFTRALAAARDEHSRPAEANALAHLAFAYQSSKAPLAAIAYLDSAAAVRRQAGLPFLDLSGAPALEDETAARSASRPRMSTRAPAVELLPVMYQSSDSTQVIIAVAASDRGAGVQDVRVYDNGAPVGTSMGGVSLTAERCPTGAACFRVVLPPGRHNIEAAATARDGTEGERAVGNVTIPGQRRQSTLYVLAIGIDDYENPEYHLSYARADAEAVADSLRAGGLKAFQRPAVVEVLLDLHATRDSIEARLLRLARVMKPEDTFVLYYAGHGKETTIGAGTSFYLVPADVRDMVDPEALATKGISSARLLELLRNVPARQKLVIIDACQSGGVASAYSWQDPARTAFAQLAVGAGTWILAASRPQEFAAESATLGHGVFTYALLKALGGDGSGRPRDIGVAGLLSEVGARLPELSIRAKTPPQTLVALAVGELFTIGVR